MEYLLYVIGAGSIYWGVNVLASVQWNSGNPASWIGYFAIFAGIMVAAFGNVIALLKQNLKVLNRLADKG